jgi:hypothetical protein
MCLSNKVTSIKSNYRFCHKAPPVKSGLHYGDYRSKLVGFETQQNIFYVKKALAESDNRHSVNTTLQK